VESGHLSTGNHALSTGRNLPRTSGANCGGNLEAAANFEHGDNVVVGDATTKPEAGGGYIDGALGIVKRLCRNRHNLCYAEYRDMPSESDGKWSTVSTRLCACNWILSTRHNPWSFLS